MTTWSVGKTLRKKGKKRDKQTVDKRIRKSNIFSMLNAGVTTFLFTIFLFHFMQQQSRWKMYAVNNNNNGKRYLQASYIQYNNHLPRSSLPLLIAFIFL